MASVVELLYIQATASLERMAAYARAPRSIPYRARFEPYGRIVCGSSPWLNAEKVENLVVSVDPETHIETISWSTLAIHDGADPSRAEPMIPSVRRSFRRLIEGPVSSERRWDALHNRFKPGLEAPDV